LNTVTKKDFSIGVVVFYNGKEGVEYLLLKHKQGHWSFSKGHPDEGEETLETALRELREETGIRELILLNKEPLLKEKYKFINKKRKHVLKNVEYFIGEVKNKTVHVDGMEILDCKWCSYQTGINTITFKESKNILNEANKIIHKKIDA
jgi:8-oxo-dGTP pyrophosphatase MutT (NUDIX family)